MPSEPRCAIHENRVSRLKLDSLDSAAIVRPLLALDTDDEYGIAADGNADQSRVAEFSHVAMHAESVAGRIQVDDGGFRVHGWEDRAQELCHVVWERWWLLARVNFRCPVVLAAEGHPSQLFVEEPLDRERFVYSGVFRAENRGRGWGKRKEGRPGRWVRHLVELVNVR